ncbi:DNA recombination protein RmuC [Candidatus Uhrbacteria bacterium]|nr:DNA recombination protein RmuC [Candidatus Uhrbacteria bacterium]
MELLLILVIILVLIGFAATFYFLHKKLSGGAQDQVISLLNQNIQGIQQRIDKTTETIGQRLDKAAWVIQNVQRELGAMQEIGRSIKDFQEFISSPKLRGNIGEQVLYDALAKTFPKDHYATQFKFREGQTVDAIVRTREGMIPIDSKFPMEYFKKMTGAATADERASHLREFTRSVKKHIDDVAKKYILPHEGTVDFAVMYIPSESIYYEIIVDSDEIGDHAQNRKVLLVSPNGFFHFLRVLMMGLERSKLQEGAQRIWELLKAVQQDTQKFGETLGVLNRHVTNAKNIMDSATSEYTKLASKIDQVKLLK